jgi:membrane-bound ClpP family serine protease
MVDAPAMLAVLAPPLLAATNGMIIWAIVMFFVALVLVALEVVIPSGGLLGLLAALCAAGGVFLLFRVDTAAGLAGALGVLIAIPIILAFMIKYWEYTPLARLLILRDDQAGDAPGPGQPDPAQAGDAAPSAVPVVGTQGKALSDLRPVGACIIQGRRIDCHADGPMIEQGQTVRVTHVEPMQIKVRAVL